MQEFLGIRIAPGFAIGKIRLLQSGTPDVPDYTVQDTEAELLRFSSAVEKAKLSLGKLHGQTAEEADAETAEIFRAQQMILSDTIYLSAIQDMISNEKRNAEAAVRLVTEQNAAALSATDDPLVQERIRDLRDAESHILSSLSASEEKHFAQSPFLLAAESMTPGELMGMDHTFLKGILTASDSVNSHTAILSRALGVPYLTGIPITADFDGTDAILDADKEKLMLSPGDALLFRYRLRHDRSGRAQHRLSSYKNKESITKSGRRLPVCANILSPAELPEVLEKGAEGIGLFRSEFLFLGKETLPDEETQLQAYRSVLEAMPEREVVIRTIDLGADKELPSAFRVEEPEGQKLRGIRFALAHKEIFRIQLRALLRASVYGRLSILYPMVSEVSELKETETLMAQIQEELSREQLPVGSFSIGAMIETPEAVRNAAALMQKVDFFSIGTNDLTMYTLGLESRETIAADYDPKDSRILSQIQQVIEVAHAVNKQCRICGELAADTTLTKTFLDYGADALSVAPARILTLRREICNAD